MKKVLIIEDNREILSIIKFNLIKSNYEVFSVENVIVKLYTGNVRVEPNKFGGNSFIVEF